VNALAHKKLLAVIALVIILAIVGGVSWVLINSQQPELSIQEQVRDDAMVYIETNHPEAAQFMDNLAWVGGRTTSSGLIGAETYAYTSQGWNVTISYPVIQNPIYTITADYSATSANGGVSIPYRVIWQGTWENGTITETGYTFAQ
jgi:uncharacterized protein (UPF0333 family)